MTHTRNVSSGSGTSLAGKKKRTKVKDDESDVAFPVTPAADDIDMEQPHTRNSQPSATTLPWQDAVRTLEANFNFQLNEFRQALNDDRTQDTDFKAAVLQRLDDLRRDQPRTGHVQPPAGNMMPPPPLSRIGRRQAPPTTWPAYSQTFLLFRQGYQQYVNQALASADRRTRDWALRERRRLRSIPYPAFQPDWPAAQQQWRRH
ncbi:hypothetical protein KCU73_g950, partial [Aureobasidium melanogenum]